MASELTKEQWIEILLNPEITKEKDLDMFQVIYSFDGHKAYASEVGRQLGYKGKSPHVLFVFSDFFSLRRMKNS